MKYLAIALALLIVLEIPASSQNNDFGNHISFLSSPGINFSIGGVNTTLKFFTGGRVIIEDSEVNYTSIWNITKNGFMNYTYTSNALESTTVNFPVKGFSYSTVSINMLFYINTTTYIHPVSINRTFNSSNGSPIMSGNNNTLSISYNITSHRIITGDTSLMNLTQQDQQSIVVPEIFYFGNSPIPANMTFRSDNSNFNSFKFQFGNTLKSLYYTFNRTYSENGVIKQAEIEFEPLSQSHSLRMGFVFAMNGSYTNITYDPYVITPDVSLSGFNVTGPLKVAINYLVDNSEILIGGFTAGIMIIGAGYISYRKKSSL